MCPPMLLMLWNFAKINTVSLVLLIEAVSYDFYRFLTKLLCKARFTMFHLCRHALQDKLSSPPEAPIADSWASAELDPIGSHKLSRWGLASTSIHHAWAWATAPQQSRL